MNQPSRRKSGRGGFTLVEVLLASVAGALILASLYGLYSRAFHLRDDATERTRHARLRVRRIGTGDFRLGSRPFQIVAGHAAPRVPFL